MMPPSRAVGIEIGARYVMWICATTDACLCTGEDYDCQCRPLHDGARGRCLDCGARMVLIDTNTSEILSPRGPR
jgi:hypothetical protein